MIPKLWKYYLAAALIPMLLNVLATAGWVFYEYRWGDFKGLTKQQLEGENLYITFIAMAFGNGLVFAALQTPLFLNANSNVRNKTVLSLLSWSLLPLCWLLFIVSYVDPDETIILWLLLTMIVPYLVVNPWTFISYRRALKKAVAADPATAAPIAAPEGGTVTESPFTDSTAPDPEYSSPSSQATPDAPEH
jgi:hypothetical protein